VSVYTDYTLCELQIVNLLHSQPVVHVF